jgi:hypothetical protein
MFVEDIQVDGRAWNYDSTWRMMKAKAAPKTAASRTLGREPTSAGNFVLPIPNDTVSTVSEGTGKGQMLPLVLCSLHACHESRDSQQPRRLGLQREEI